MKTIQCFNCDDSASTNNANYHASTTANSSNENHVDIIYNNESREDWCEKGKYSIFVIADWFLHKEPMTHKKIQKLCYYAQAWFYAIKGFRLADADFQAWVHGPVAPALYEKFKRFGYNTIRMTGHFYSSIEPEDESLLEDVWDTYGDRTGNALEALSHRELPWIEARKGYSPNEKCTVVIDPEVMKQYYKSIYIGE